MFRRGMLWCKEHDGADRWDSAVVPLSRRGSVRSLVRDPSLPMPGR